MAGLEGSSVLLPLSPSFPPAPIPQISSLRDAQNIQLLTESFEDSGEELGLKSLDLKELTLFPDLFQEAW